jgi:hypothetical protein
MDDYTAILKYFNKIHVFVPDEMTMEFAFILTRSFEPHELNTSLHELQPRNARLNNVRVFSYI